jgi:SagB-type dehydrogenase family enzyme
VLEQTLTYHARTKHHPHRYAASAGYLDWDTQPDPFRRYEGAPLHRLERVDLDADLPYELAFRRELLPVQPLARRTVSQLFQDALGLTAWKAIRDAQGALLTRWALRANPSSGNLHPTEAYLVAGPIPGLSERPGVHHYAPREHALEQRRVLDDAAWQGMAKQLPAGGFLVGLTSIHWREAWKYGERAFRYCQLDVGHAVGALAIAAAGLGWDVMLLEAVLDHELARLLGVDAQDGIEAEHPACVLAVVPQGPAPPDVRRLRLPSATLEADAVAWAGTPNRLSPRHRAWPAIDEVAAATRKDAAPPDALWDATRPENASLTVEASPPRLRRIVHQRRSCLGLDGSTGITRAALYQILLKAMPGQDQVPFHSLPWRPRIDLALFVHRVEGLEPGLYALPRDAARGDALRSALNPDFLWEPAPEAPDSLPLALLERRDVRREARLVSCDQAIASDGAFALAMLADFRGSLESLGPWFYRRLHWEAGLLGQVLYLEAEASGIRGTGIGCFLDDATHSLLGLEGDAFADLYHFTMGGPVDDPRLEIEAPSG